MGDLIERKKWKQHLFNQRRKYLICLHCNRPRREHGKRGKCVFDSTSFRASGNSEPYRSPEWYGYKFYPATRTGRFSSAFPNISNIPKSDQVRGAPLLGIWFDEVSEFPWTITAVREDPNDRANRRSRGAQFQAVRNARFPRGAR